MPKSFNPNLIIANRSYTTEKICTLYEKQKLHPQTIREWVHNEGLKVVSMKPIVILGKDLKDFFKSRNSHKRKLAFNEFKCAKCKAISEPQNKEISIYYNKNGSIRAVGICPVCEFEFGKIYKKSVQLPVQLLKFQMMALCNTSHNSSNTNMNEPQESSSNEPQIAINTHAQECLNNNEEVALNQNIFEENLSSKSRPRGY